MKKKCNKPIFTTQEIIDPFDGVYKNFLVKAEHWERYQFAADFLKKSGLEQVWDVTCGSGYGTKLMHERGLETLGLDRNQDYLDHAKNQHREIKNYFLQIDLNSQKISELAKLKSKRPLRPQAIVCLETLEHVQSPQNLLSQFAEILMEDTANPKERYLILSVPNAKYEKIKDGKPANPFHLHFFTLQKLKFILKEAEFRIVQIYGQPWTNLIIRSKKKILIKKYNRCLQSKESFEAQSAKIAYPTKKMIGHSDSMIIVAKKKQLP